MIKQPYTPPVVEVEVIHLEFNILHSLNASGQNATWESASNFDDYFKP